MELVYKSRQGASLFLIFFNMLNRLKFYLLFKSVHNECAVCHLDNEGFLYYYKKFPPPAYDVEDLYKIIAIKASMNRGLSQKLIDAFPNTVFEKRPMVKN